MNAGERIKILRKNLNLSQKEFGKVLGLKAGSVSDIETGKNKLTERNIKLICSEFNVDYIWLTTGEGEIFSNTKEDEDYLTLIDNIMMGENEFHKNLFKTLAKLDENELKTLENIIDKLLENKISSQ